MSGSEVLIIDNLHVDIGDKSILKGINLEVMPGEMHAIMGRMALQETQATIWPKSRRPSRTTNLNLLI